MTLYILNYNNYYNRIVKRETELENYMDHVIYGPLSGTNFVPNDGVNTTHIIGNNTAMYDGRGDYLLVLNEYNEIDSRWFIIEANRARGGQYKLTLRRDLIVDYYDNILEADVFIEKATLAFDDELIFNKENMTVNQIKTSELKLKDKTNSAWIVGYYDNSKSEGGNYLSAEVQNTDYPYDIAIPGTLEEWEYYQNQTTDFIGYAQNFQYNFYIENRLQGFYSTFLYKITKDNNTVVPYANYTIGTMYFQRRGTGAPSSDTLKTSISEISSFSTLDAMLRNYIFYTSREEEDYFINLNNKTLRFSDGIGGYRYFFAKITSEYKRISRDIVSGNLFDELKEISLNAGFKGDATNKTFKGIIEANTYRIELTEIDTGNFTLEIKDTVQKPLDAPYGIFAIPYPDTTITIKNTGGTDFQEVTVNKELAFNMANALSKKYSGGGTLYDLQLLPYCPVQSIIKEDGSLDLENKQINYSVITLNDGNNSTVKGVVLHSSKASFTLDIPLENPIKSINPKMENETDLYRLVSPNYNGQFEFNASKNNGVSRINVDCTYLPYNPYIHLNIDFKNLYGKDFDDARGLICSGDFSLAQINDAWQTYQIQNKNYENIFNREIKNLELNNRVAREQQIINSALGTITGAASGAASGSTGGPAGAIAGAVAGAVAGGLSSAVAGIADVAYGDILRNEAVDYKQDLFGFQLGNIMAMPQSIGKTTAYTYNNKIYPILEYYTCTEREKKALANKIAFNGMTVMAIGKIIDYINNEWSYEEIVDKGYIKGKLIRMPEINEDYHIINSIAGELNKGVYFK